MKRETQIWAAVFLLAGVYLAWRAASVGIGSQYAREVDGWTTPASAADVVAGTARLSWPRTAGTWLAAMLTLCIMSFLYRDNPFYKTAEAVLIGVSAAYWMVVGFWDVLVPNLLGRIWPAAIQSWAMPGLSPEREPLWSLYLIPLVLGVMLLWRMAPRGGWISRWPLAFVIGTTAGLRLVAYLQADFLSQIRSSILSVITTDAEGSLAWGPSIKNGLLLSSTLFCLVYFFFSLEHKGVVGRLSKTGIWVLMVTFGAAFGYTVMGRIALLSIRLEFLFDDWLWLIDPTQKRLGL